jgi:hypothetical protein
VVPGHKDELGGSPGVRGGLRGLEGETFASADFDLDGGRGSGSRGKSKTHRLFLSCSMRACLFWRGPSKRGKADLDTCMIERAVLGIFKGPLRELSGECMVKK